MQRSRPLQCGSTRLRSPPELRAESIAPWVIIRPMRLLILGGGVFLGAATLDASVRRGHTVTVFNRGRSRTAWPAGVEAIEGDRAADLARLAGRRWDAVIDTCGYVPSE